MFIVILLLIVALVADSVDLNRGYLCDGVNEHQYESCKNKKKILVVDWGYVDSGTGAANRHLEMISLLGGLGHYVFRGAVQVRETPKLPSPANVVFDKLQIRQVRKKLTGYVTITQPVRNKTSHAAAAAAANSTVKLSKVPYFRSNVTVFEEFVKSWKPDMIIVSLWFCGATMHDTAPAYLLPIHEMLKKPKFSSYESKFVIETSDVHSLRKKRFINEPPPRPPKSRGMSPRQDAKVLAQLAQRDPVKDAEDLQKIELKLLSRADGVLTISHEDRTYLETLDDNLKKKNSIHVVRYASVNPIVGSTSQVPISGNSKSRKATYQDRLGYVFVGPGSVPTNRAAIDWFLREVWPHLYKNPYTGEKNTFTVVGKWNSARLNYMGYNTTGRAILCAMAAGGGGKRKKSPTTVTYTCGEDEDAFKHIRWVGKLSEKDLEKTLASARVFVSPIEFSTGINTKNVLALERAIPLVVTRAGVGGICLQDTNGAGAKSMDMCMKTLVDTGPSIAIASTGDAQSFTKLARDAHDNKDSWDELSEGGFNFWNENLQLHHAAKDLDFAMKKIGLFDDKKKVKPLGKRLDKTKKRYFKKKGKHGKARR